MSYFDTEGPVIESNKPEYLFMSAVGGVVTYRTMQDVLRHSAIRTRKHKPQRHVANFRRYKRYQRIVLPFRYRDNSKFIHELQ
mmetsp:Transcript_25993/g.71302  ORF Transcript_25993/g.71302 Transcript_25993/m.71302 type:complete len:83 (-) Transcript_25993:143-391(-)